MRNPTGTVVVLDFFLLIPISAEFAVNAKSKSIAIVVLDVFPYIHHPYFAVYIFVGHDAP